MGTVFRLVTLLVLAFSSGPNPILQAEEITVFAAVSLSESLRQIAREFERQCGDTVALNLGASSLLARQIISGAPADIFFSADEAQMNTLEEKGRIVADTRKSRLGNQLVIIVPSDSSIKINSATNILQSEFNHIALAEPRSVPAGIYARRFLEQQNLWAALESKVVPTENVRAALAAVESGDAEAGFVYKTDAAISRKVRIAFSIPATEGPAIRYPVALVRDGPHPEAARRWMAFLMSKPAGEIFRRQGFIVFE